MRSSFDMMPRGGGGAPLGAWTPSIWNGVMTCQIVDLALICYMHMDRNQITTETFVALPGNRVGMHLC
jgi:hypothetical protein